MWHAQSNLRNFIFLVLCLPLFSCVKNNSISENQIALPSTLNANILTEYNNGHAIIIFAYSDTTTTTEAYADWAAYLNDFKSTTGEEFKFHRIERDELKSTIPDISNISEYSVFIKKGFPSYLYKDFIVEPQVYTAVFHDYNQEELTTEDKNFLPGVITLSSFKK